jgi:hypothetical protein
MTDEEHRLLLVLAGGADGSTDALLRAHGFKLDVLIRLVSAEFATATPERVFAAGKPVEVTRVQITDAARRTPADQRLGNLSVIQKSPADARGQGQSL